MKKESKARIAYANNESLRTRCLACIRVVEQQTRQITQRRNTTEEFGSADAEQSPLEEESAMATPENIDLVFGLFHSVPEVVHLDSIYKKQLFLELRIRRFAAGSKVRPRVL